MELVLSRSGIRIENGSVSFLGAGVCGVAGAVGEASSRLLKSVNGLFINRFDFVVISTSISSSY